MKLLSRLLKGSPVTPPKRTPTPEWHPLDELEDEPWNPPHSVDEIVQRHMAEIDDDPIACDCQDPAGAGQCTAPTKTGRPCSKPPRPGSDRCTLPAHQRA